METDDNFQMTSDEMSRMKEAMKDKKFVELLLDYSREISDPENKKKYEEEIIAMERQKGQSVRLLHPTSGFVVKTVRLSDEMKVFLNICTSPEIEDCTLIRDTVGGKEGTHCSLPHSLSPAREDVDKVGKPCIVYDICFNPNTFAKSLNDLNFRNMLVDAAFDTLEKQGTDKFNRKNKRFPKMKYKGTPQTNILRTVNTETMSNPNPTAVHDSATNLMGSVADTTMGEQKAENSKDKDSSIGINTNIHVAIRDDQALEDEKDNILTTPEYKIVHRGYFDLQNYTHSREGCSSIPKELIVNINLPLAKSAAGLDLDIFKKELILDSKEPLYHLEVSLPYEVNETEGNAQFDTAEKVLTVTLPVIKPQVKDIVCDIAPPSVVEDVTDLLNCDKMNKQTLNDLNCTSSLQNGLTDRTDMQENGPLDDTVFSMIHDNFPSNTDDTGDVDIDTLREHLKKARNFNASTNDINIEFDTSNLESFPCSSKIPSYSYIQTPEKIVLTIDIPNVEIICLSLGFSSQQAYMSYPRNPEDVNSACWEMVIRLDDECYLDKDNCGVDITDNTIDLILRKRQDCVRLWDKFFVGVSEASLKVEFFTTNNIAEDMLKNASDLETCKEDGVLLDNNFANLESRLSQLLQEQEDAGGVTYCDDVFSEPVSGEITSQNNLLNLEKSDGITEESEVTESKFNGDEYCNIPPVLDVINVQDSDIQPDPNKNDVNIIKGEVDSSTDSSIQNSPSPFESHIKTNRGHGHTPHLMSPDNSRINKTRRGRYGRSLSSGNNEEDTMLHSILKKSKSEEDFDTEDELTSSSCSSFADPDFILGTSPVVFECGRRRYKSVTFNDEPTVFEFTKLSKKDIKRQMKEERIRSASLPKNMLFQNVKDETEGHEKQSKNKGKAAKKLNRSHSDSLLQIPSSILNYNKNQKKKKKDKKRYNQGIEGQPSDINSDPLPESNVKERKISNSLIFELE